MTEFFPDRDCDLEALFSELRDQYSPNVSYQEKLLGKLKRQWVFMNMKKSIMETTPGKMGFFKRNVFGLSIASFLLISTGFVTTFAYQSDAVTSQSLLYPIKRTLEEVEQQFIITPEEHAEYHLKMMKRRLAEARYLSEEGFSEEDAFHSFDEQFEKGVIRIMNIPEEEKRSEYFDRLEKFLDWQHDSGEVASDMRISASTKSKSDGKKRFDQKMKEKVKKKLQSLRNMVR